MNLKTKPIPTSLILGISLVIALLWAYWPVLTSLAAKLSTDEDQSFALLLPFVSGYIVYLKWPQIRGGPWRPAWMGVVVLALGLFLYNVGEASTDLYTPRLSFVVSLSGVFFIFGGWRMVRLLGFPLLLLALMVPLPDFVIRQITLPLQLISSRLATEMLQFVGIPAVRQGNIIDLGVRQLQIVAACSGLRYILSLMAMGIIYCYFYQRRLWKVAILLLSLIPAAIIANALRVAAMGIYPALLEGFWHGFSGWLIFVFCLGFLFLVNWVLSYRQPKIEREAGPEAPSAEIMASGAKPSYLRHIIVALCIVLAAGYFAQTVGNIAPVPLRQSFDNFPSHLGSGRESVIMLPPKCLKPPVQVPIIMRNFPILPMAQSSRYGLLTMKIRRPMARSTLPLPA